MKHINKQPVLPLLSYEEIAAMNTSDEAVLELNSLYPYGYYEKFSSEGHINSNNRLCDTDGTLLALYRARRPKILMYIAYENNLWIATQSPAPVTPV